MSSDVKNRVERRHRVEPAVEPALEFVEVRLQVVMGDGSVMGAHDPRLQIGDNQMHHWQVRVCLVGVAVQCHAFVAVSERFERRIPGEGVGSHGGFGGNITNDKLGACESAAIWDHAEPQPSGIDEPLEGLAALMFAASLCGTVFVVLSQPDFHGGDDVCHFVDAFAFAASASADQTFIDFHGIFPADRVALGPHHSGAQLVEDLEGRFVSGKPKLPLELQRGLPWGLRRDEVGRPEPR